jgi:hypothetical protein
MHDQNRSRTVSALAVIALVFCVRASNNGAWTVEQSGHRVVSRPVGAWRGEKVAVYVYVTCSSGQPQFAILVRDPVTAKLQVTLQFSGHSGQAIAFVGKDGVVRKYNSFTRGSQSRLAIASPEDSRLIVAELLRGHTRLAWIVDTTGDGLDSLEVPAGSFANAWEQLRCGVKPQ